MSVDVGGTFTDLVLSDVTSGSMTAFHKVLTDADRPARSVVTGWQELLELAGTTASQVNFAVHSTTIVTNAILERQGVETALITTRGFRDVLEIGIEQIYDIYDLFAPYPQPLVPRELRFEIDERVSRDGDILEPLDEQSVERVIDALIDRGVRSVAVSLIHAYRNPSHERRIADLIRARFPEATVSLSSQVVPLIGEYERTSTVVADAYVKPLVQRYVHELTQQLDGMGYHGPLYMMLSSGGIATASAAIEYPIRLLESGPAAGAYAAGFYGQLTRNDNLLSFDMGGTTAKACLIEDGVPGVAHMLEVERMHRFKPGSGLPIMAPSVELIEIGAGGGSIAHINNLGLLNVGPQSAGSNPGPACYGLGGEQPTVTDANLCLGYLDPSYFLGGRMSLNSQLAQSAIDTYVARPLNMSSESASEGINSIVTENMAAAARTHLIERNRDPRDVAIVAFGGAGPAHAIDVARILGITQVIVPFGAGVASAIGALTAPMSLPFVRSYMVELDACDWQVVDRLYDEMKAEALAALSSASEVQDVTFRLATDMRFRGQYHEIRVELPIDSIGAEAASLIEEAFLLRYQNVYGRAPSSLSVEVLNWHLIAETQGSGFTLTEEPQHERDHLDALKGFRQVSFRGLNKERAEHPVYDRYLLEPGAVFPGPCVVEEQEATIVIPPNCQVAVDGFRNIVVSIEQIEEI